MSATKTSKKKKKKKKKTAKRPFRQRSQKVKAEFVEKWNEAGKAAVMPEVKFKNRGGTKFTLSLNGNKLHDIIAEECNLGGTQKISGETKPRDLIDTYRSVLFFMWGIPLDTPVDKEALKGFKKAIRRMKKEDPELFEEKK